MSSAIRFLGPTPLPAGVRPYHVWLLRLLFARWPPSSPLTRGCTSSRSEAPGSRQKRPRGRSRPASRVLAALGVVNPLKMLPILLLEIFCKHGVAGVDLLDESALALAEADAVGDGNGPIAVRSYGALPPH